jgi:ribosomal protein S18 acetylase RimI-like enzyme
MSNVSTPQIVSLNAADIPRYGEVIRKSFATVAEDFGWTNENTPEFRAFLSDDRLAAKCKPGYYSFGYERDGFLFGYAAITDMGDGVFEMNQFDILPEWRHLGYGRKLLNFCKVKTRELGGHTLTLNYIEENTVLKNYYLANGFEHTGTKKFSHLPFTVGYMKCAVC